MICLANHAVPVYGGRAPPRFDMASPVNTRLNQRDAFATNCQVASDLAVTNLILTIFYFSHCELSYLLVDTVRNHNY
jgi:hypothetical protein